MAAAQPTFKGAVLPILSPSIIFAMICDFPYPYIHISKLGIYINNPSIQFTRVTG